MLLKKTQNYSHCDIHKRGHPEFGGLIRGTFTLNDAYENLYFVQTASTDGAWEVRSGVLTIAGIPIESSQPQEISPVGHRRIYYRAQVMGAFGIGDPT